MVGNVVIQFASRNRTKTLVQRNLHGCNTTLKVHVVYEVPEEDEKEDKGLMPMISIFLRWLLTKLSRIREMW